MAIEVEELTKQLMVIELIYKKGLVLGPGDIKQAHGDNEYVEKSQLKKQWQDMAGLLKVIRIKVRWTTDWKQF